MLVRIAQRARRPLDPDEVVRITDRDTKRKRVGTAAINWRDRVHVSEAKGSLLRREQQCRR